MTYILGVRVKELAAWLEAGFEGDGERAIRRVAPLEDAGPEDLSFATRGRALKIAGESRAACILVPVDFPTGTGRTIIRTADPRAAAARAIPKIHPKIDPQPGVHPTAILGPGAIVGYGASIGPLVTIGAGVKVGAGSSIGAGSVIGDYVLIGSNCTIHPRVTIYREVVLGDEVVLHSG